MRLRGAQGLHRGAMKPAQEPVADRQRRAEAHSRVFREFRVERRRKWSASVLQEQSSRDPERAFGGDVDRVGPVRPGGLARLAGERIHQQERIEIHAIDPGLIGHVVSRLERRMVLDLSVSEQVLYLSVGEETLSGSVERLRLG